MGAVTEVSELAVQEGDFVLLDYIAMVETEEGGEKKQQVFDTTIKEEAEKAGLELARLGPTLIVVGKKEGIILPAVEEELIGLEEGQWKTIKLPPEKAFGKRDPNKIVTISARELSRQGVIPRVGEEISANVRGRVIRGKVIFVGGGRVTIDTNHPFAGRHVLYKVKVVKVLKSTEERVKALIDRWLGTLEGIEYSVEDGRLVISLPVGFLAASNLAPAINGLARNIEDYLPEIKEMSVVFKFEFARKQEEKEEKPQQEQEETPEGTEETLQHPQS